ncbi:hypothetical protein [Paraburkholderia sp. MM5482-R1]|uniref:hypothetical protein n=1 Tax=Paraburkholderia sp. MM5482-R1 TaxID=2991063 RepID=UPI003D25F871
MSNALFGPIVEQLSEVDLGRALTTIGLFYPSWEQRRTIDALIAANASNFHRVAAGESTKNNVEMSLQIANLQAYVNARLTGKLFESGGPGKLWLKRWATLFSGARCPIRYCLDLRGEKTDPSLAIDIDALMQVLSRSSTDCVGVYAAWPPEHLDLAWHWPLRLGFLAWRRYNNVTA